MSDERTESGGRTLASLAMAGAVGVGALTTLRNVKQAEAANATLRAGADRGKGIQKAWTAIEELVQKAGVRPVEQVEIDEAVQRIVKVLEGQSKTSPLPPLTNHLRTAWEGAVYYGGPHYRSQHSKLMQMFGTSGTAKAISPEAIIEHIGHELSTRKTLDETRGVFDNFRKNFFELLKASREGHPDMVRLSGRASPVRKVVGMDAFRALSGNSEFMKQKLANFQTKYGAQFSYAPSVYPGAGGVGSLRFEAGGVAHHLDVPMAFGPGGGMISTGPVGQSLFMPGRFMVYGQEGVAGRAMTFSEFALWRAEQYLPNIEAATSPEAARSLFKQYRAEMGTWRGESTPAIGGLLEPYQELRAGGYITRLQLAEGGPVGRLVPYGLEGGKLEVLSEAVGGKPMSYAGVAKGSLASTVSTVPTSDIIPFGYSYLTPEGQYRDLWGVGARPEITIRDWGPSPKAIEAAEKLQRLDPTRLSWSAFKPAIYGEAIPEPLERLAFIDYDLMRRQAKWMSDGAGISRESQIVRDLTERTSVKTIRIQASELDVGEKLRNFMAGGQQFQAIAPGTFGRLEQLGFEEATGAVRLLEEGEEVISLARTPKVKGSAIQDLIEVKVQWTPPVEAGSAVSTKFFFGPRVEMPFDKQAWKSMAQEVSLEEAYRAVEARTDLPVAERIELVRQIHRDAIRGIARSERVSPIKELKRVRALQHQQMFTGLMELERQLMKRAGADAIQLLRHDIEVVEGLFQRMQTERWSPQTMAETMLGRAAALETQYGPLSPVHISEVFGGLRYYSEAGLKGMETPAAVEAGLEQLGMGAGATRTRFAQALAKDPLRLQGVFRLASKGPTTELGAGGMGSIEPRMLFTSAHYGPEGQVVMAELLKARRWQAPELEAAGAELLESVRSIMGQATTKTGEAVPLEMIPSSAHELAEMIEARGGQGFWAKPKGTLAMNLGGIEANVEKFWVPGTQHMEFMMGARDVPGGTPIRNYLVEPFSEVIEAMRATELGRSPAEASARATAALERGINPALFATLTGFGSGSNVKGLLRGKIPMSRFLTITAMEQSLKLKAGQVAVSQHDASEMLGEVKRIRGAAEAKRVQKALWSEEGAISAFWRHPTIHPLSLQTVRARIDPTLKKSQLLMPEQAMEVSLGGKTKRWRVDELAAAFGDYDADHGNLFFLPSETKAITTQKMVQSEAMRYALISEGMKAPGGELPAGMSLDKIRQLEATKGQMEKMMTGIISVPSSALRAGVLHGLEGGAVGTDEALKLGSLLGLVEQVPISARHYSTAQMETAAREAQNVANWMKLGMNPAASAQQRQQAIGGIAGYLRSAVDARGSTDPFRQAATKMFGGGSVSLMAGLSGTAQEAMSLKAYNLESDLGRLFDLGKQLQIVDPTAKVSPATLMRHITNPRAKVSMAEAFGLTAQKSRRLLDIFPGMEMLVGGAGKEALGERLASGATSAFRRLAQAGERILPHATPLAFGFAGALAIGSFFSSPGPVVSGDKAPPRPDMGRRSGTDLPLGPSQPGLMLQGHPGAPAGIMASPKAYIQKAGRFVQNTWRAEISARPRADVDANQLASELSQVTRNRANINVNVRNWRNKLSQRQAEDMVLGEI